MNIDLPALLDEQVFNWGRLGHPALIERFVLRNGTLYDGCARPKGVRRGQMKECFRNSANAVFRNQGWAYCEGIAVSSSLMFPIHHAWCVKDDKVIDLTWEDPADCVYFGVTFDVGELAEQIAINGVYGLFDTGRGLNSVLMFARDPELEAIVREVACRPFRVKDGVAA
jgi:hypothetical protein